MARLSILLIVFLIILTVIFNVRLIGENRELHFYQVSPPCSDAKAVYLIFRNGSSEAMHRVYVCGYSVKER